MVVKKASVLWLKIWPNKCSTRMFCWRNYFYVQPVLDFLLWHHLGPNYEERAHDLLQVSIPKTSNVSCDRCTSNISPTLSMEWTLPPWSNSTYGGQRYHSQGQLFFSPKVALISVEILVTVVVWVLARTPPTFIVRPAVDQNLGGTQPRPKSCWQCPPLPLGHIYSLETWLDVVREWHSNLYGYHVNA